MNFKKEDIHFIQNIYMYLYNFIVEICYFNFPPTFQKEEVLNSVVFFNVRYNTCRSVIYVLIEKNDFLFDRICSPFVPI